MLAIRLLAKGRMEKPLTAKEVTPAAGSNRRKFLLFMLKSKSIGVWRLVEKQKGGKMGLEQTLRDLDA